MSPVKLNGLLCGAVFAAVLFAAPARAADESGAQSGPPVTCKDGTTAPHGGKGACHGHGGIAKAEKSSAGGKADKSSAASSAKSAGSAAPAAGSAKAAKKPAKPAEPATATVVTCNDGTTAPNRIVCRRHGGLKVVSKGAAAAPSPAGSAAAPAVKPAAPAAAAQAAPGGGAGRVWLNTESNVYHCAGTQWYGKTKQGAFMSEAEAKTRGGRPDHDKPCA